MRAEFHSALLVVVAINLMGTLRMVWNDWELMRSRIVRNEGGRVEWIVYISWLLWSVRNKERK